jgi:hypothetical protein
MMRSAHAILLAPFTTPLAAMPSRLSIEPNKMLHLSFHRVSLLLLAITTGSTLQAQAPSIQITPSQETGWQQLSEPDFVRVNGDDKTLVWDGTVAYGSGLPIGVTRTKDIIENFELLIQWRHMTSAGNSGVFAWVDPSALENLPPGELPKSGIEVQMLDHGYIEKYKQSTGRDPDFFTTNGDIFAVGKSTMKPFPPLSPNGSRSFPKKKMSKGVGEWNQYYVRGINGEIRLWVNGEEVSGGRECNPRSGYLCLESEGAPIEFREIYLRKLP